MKVFAIGDLHLDGGANKPMDLFGTQWTSHQQKIENHWRNLVAEEDYVLIPGDISWAMRLQNAVQDLRWLETLPGQKICIRGNHDYWWDRPGKLNKAYESIYFLQNTSYRIGELAICGTRGWVSPDVENYTEEDQRIYDRELQRLRLSLEDSKKQGAKEIWVMLHYPPTMTKRLPHKLIELLNEYPVTKVIYGHLHDEMSWIGALKGVYEGREYSLVAADYIQFCPRQIGEIK